MRHSRMNFTKYCATIMLVGFSMSGCLIPYATYYGTSTHDVTNNTKHHHYYKPGQVYALRQNSTIMPVQGNAHQLGKIFTITPGYSEAEYKKKLSRLHKDEAWYLELVDDKPEPKALIKQGTRFTIVQIFRIRYWLYGRIDGVHYTAIGELQDGPFKGSLFSLDNLSDDVWFNNERDMTTKPNQSVELIE